MMRWGWLMVGCLLTGVAWGQYQQKADSVQALLAQPDLSDSTRYVLLRTLAHDETDFAQGLAYAREALAMARELGDPTLEALAWEEIGAIQRLLGNRTEAELAALTALRVYENAQDSASMGPVLIQLGNNALSDAEYNPAIDYYRHALAI
ncbi:MAG TPA: hypothetical protein DCR93_21750, partial [Cytophagales bacterium]|nr:hypothetical protein [Cytophagales bacterium]